MDAFQMNSTHPNINNIKVNLGEIWSCYPKNHTIPADKQCKNIIVKIKQDKQLEIIVNSLENIE